MSTTQKMMKHKKVTVVVHLLYPPPLQSETLCWTGPAVLKKWRWGATVFESVWIINGCRKSHVQKHSTSFKEHFDTNHCWNHNLFFASCKKVHFFTHILSHFLKTKKSPSFYHTWDIKSCQKNFVRREELRGGG